VVIMRMEKRHFLSAVSIPTRWRCAPDQ
jgi:hypothetical protein